MCYQIHETFVSILALCTHKQTIQLPHCMHKWHYITLLIAANKYKKNTIMSQRNFSEKNLNIISRTTKWVVDASALVTNTNTFRQRLEIAAGMQIFAKVAGNFFPQHKLFTTTEHFSEVQHCIVLYQSQVLDYAM